GPVTTATAPAVSVTSSPDPSPATVPVDPDEPVTTPTTSAPVTPIPIDVYFVEDASFAVPVKRVAESPNTVAADAIKALIAGPTDAEQAAGLYTAIPTETLPLGVTIADGLATVDLSREFEMGGGSTAMLSRLAQVVYTLTQFPTVDGVSFKLDGQPITVFSGEGILLEHPVDRSDYLSLLPIQVAPPPHWTQADLPTVQGVPADQLGRVVLVAEDDVLNVRDDPGVDNDIIGALAPGVVVIRTGEWFQVGSSVWEVIETPGGFGWVNSTFLGAVVDSTVFAADSAVTSLLAEMGELMATDGDLSQIASSRGIYISHFAPLDRWSAKRLATAMTDTTTYKWGSIALEPDSPELPSRTFAQAVGDRFVSAYDDTDTQIATNEILAGGNGILPDSAIPFELTDFNYVAVYDPGDNPQYGGLDWTAWYVSIDYENGLPVVIGLTLNEWGP
ncbi:MAG: GerMN domain-containing protein, partial [Acidimicrobiia bacterium]|nr:GerMN domain-containing protein [Acidimicrobiia bacterium]